jgi:hypothetical protein
MKRLLAGILLLFTCVAAQAQIVGTLPYTFANGTVIDAGQVNSDFSYIVSQVNTNAVAVGANSTITSILGLTTPLSAGQGGSSVYTAGTSTGSANAQVVATPTPAGFTLVGRPTIIFTAGYTNTSSVQINVNSTGLTNVYKPSQSGPVALTGGEITAGSLIVATYNGAQYELISNIPLVYSLPGVLGFTQANDGTHPTYIMDLNASRVVLANPSGGTIQFLSPSQCQINFTTVGSYGGLDTGTVTQATWYYTYYVSNGTSLGCFASTSATAPAISASYYFVRVGAVTTGAASTNLTAISQVADVVTYTTQLTITPNASPQAIAPFFPPTAKQFIVNLDSAASAAGYVTDNATHKCGANNAPTGYDIDQNIVCANLGANFSAISTTGTNTFVAYGWRENAPVN